MNFNKIYLCTSNDVITGGVEATYQLYYILKNAGRNVKLILLDPQIHPQFHLDWLSRHQQSFKTKYPLIYKKYNIDENDLVYEVEDISSNFFLAPEIYPDMLSTFSNIQKGIWWLSVDNGLGPDQRDFITKRNHSDIWHLYQSEYAHWFLINNNISKLSKLTDFISIEYRNLSINLKEKQDVILYNPKKGIETTLQLIQNHPQFDFIPIQNMTPNEIKELMVKSKIYIDFGNHPGKDRIPREAALCGCCVITGFKGSAMFFNDVNIFNSYKFDDDLSNFDTLVEDIFNNFEQHYSNFSFYRKQIDLEKEQFELEVKKFF